MKITVCQTIKWVMYLFLCALENYGMEFYRMKLHNFHKKAISGYCSMFVLCLPFQYT